jgi:large subunit ribosomal protein L25
MSENKLVLQGREIVGKKLKNLRASGLIPSVVYGGKTPILAQSSYNETEKALKTVGYHSPLDLEIDGKKQMAMVKSVGIDPVKRKIVNVEFMAISANEVVEAMTPIVIVGFEGSEAARVKYKLLQVVEEVEVKAKPADLPKGIEIDASGLKDLEDKITLGDLKLPNGVEFVDKEMDLEQPIANLFDEAAEAAARDAEDEAVSEVAEVPADNGATEAEAEKKAE